MELFQNGEWDHALQEFKEPLTINLSTVQFREEGCGKQRLTTFQELSNGN
jgi:hypothetical protein